MGSNYQTTNDNITEKVNQLEQRNYKELIPTDEKDQCDFLVISHVDKKFFYTKSNNINHFQQLLNTLN